MELFSVVADAPGQFAFNEHMNILCRFVKGQLPRFQIGQDSPQPLGDGGALILGKDPAGTEHGGMSQRTLNILFVHPGIETDRGVKVICQLIGGFFSPSRPHFFHRFVLSFKKNTFYRNCALGFPGAQSFYFN